MLCLSIIPCILSFLTNMLLWQQLHRRADVYCMVLDRITYTKVYISAISTVRDVYVIFWNVHMGCHVLQLDMVFVNSLYIREWKCGFCIFSYTYSIYSYSYIKIFVYYEIDCGSYNFCLHFIHLKFLKFKLFINFIQNFKHFDFFCIYLLLQVSIYSIF